MKFQMEKMKESLISEKAVKPYPWSNNTPKQLHSAKTQLGKQVTELMSDNQLTKKFDKLRSALKSGDTSGRQRTR